MEAVLMTPTDLPAEPHRSALGRYARALAAPLVLWILLVVTLREPLLAWLRGENTYDREVLQEWLEEARGFRDTLPEMIDSYLKLVRQHEDLRKAPANPGDSHHQTLVTQAEVARFVRRGEIQEYLRTLGTPPTKEYPLLLPLFPIIYRLEIRLDAEPGAPIVWDSELPSESTPYPELVHTLRPGAVVHVRYQLHAYNKRQRQELEHRRRVWQLVGLAVVATVLGLSWVILGQRREREGERQRLLTRQRMDEAERRHAEAEKQLLEQRLATQAAEQKALELRSQLYASIGIMAGSYAHNIKNLLVRPNDLLRRCLEGQDLVPEQQTMLHEVQQTLGTVTQRLQEILRTVRRDPARVEPALLDMNALVASLEQTWRELARDKWKLEVATEPAKEPLWVAADASHLQQAVENLLFNARDATFEMRNHLRDSARKDEGLDAAARRQALIAAAAWRGRVVLRTYLEADKVVLEVTDNGAGMTEEVRRRCTETHFSTKRDNAIYEGQSTGMGLGLSFVVTVLEHHRARLEIESQPLHGTTFRIRFLAAQAG
jgi:signal transduction histidine kinase